MGKTHTVFVYDLLRRGMPNHFLLRDAEFLGMAETVESYAMYVTAIPYVVKTEAICPILGEAYAVDDALLLNIDRLEGHPFWFQREQAPIRLADSGEERMAWIYFHPQRNGGLCPQGDYMEWFAKEPTRWRI